MTDLYLVHVDGDDAPREVAVRVSGAGWVVTKAHLCVEQAHAPETPPRAAVAYYAGALGWPVMRIVAPGETT